MRCRVYATVGCPSVRPSVRPLYVLSINIAACRSLVAGSRIQLPGISEMAKWEFPAALHVRTKAQKYAVYVTETSPF